MISLSGRMPSARKTMNKGIGLLPALGMKTPMFNRGCLTVGAMMRIDIWRTGLDTFSLTERKSAEYRYWSCLSLYTLSMLSPNASWGMTTFSLPLMMKYPPLSLRHSPMAKRISRGMPFKTHDADCTMMGNRPKKMLGNSILMGLLPCACSLVCFIRMAISEGVYWFFRILPGSAFSLSPTS